MKLVAAVRADWKAAPAQQPLVADAVLELYDRERAGLERYLRILGVDPGNAADIVHDAFVKLHEHLQAAGDRNNLRAWLYRVAHNEAQNRRRSAGSSRTEGIDAVSAEIAAPVPSPEELVLSRERDDRVSAAVARLTAGQRECLLLRSQGFRYREIAAILQLSTSTVGETVQRAIERVRELL